MRLHGKSGLVLLGVTPGAAASPVAFLSDWEIDFTGTFVEVTPLTERDNKIWTPGLPDTAGTFSGFFDDSSRQTYLMARDGLPRNFYLYPDRVDDPQQYWWGTVIADFTGTSDIGAAVAVKANWRAATPIVEVTGAFTVFATANLAGQGNVIVLTGAGSSLAGAGSDGAQPTIQVSAAIAGQGNANTIPGTLPAVGAGVTALVVPIIAPFAPAPGTGVAGTVPIISVTTDDQANPIAGLGVVTASATVATLAGQVYAYPGRTWQRHFQHPQLPVNTPTAAGTVFPGPASATGTALGQDQGANIAAISVPAAVAAATGAAQGPTILSVPTPTALQAVPGLTWKRNFWHRQQPRGKVSTGAGTPYLIGTVAAVTGSAVNPAMTVSTPTAAGDVITVVCTGSSSSVNSVADSQGNTYTQRNSDTGGVGVATQMFTADGSNNPGGTAALSTSDTITPTWASTAPSKTAIAVGCAGLSSSPIDQTPTADSAGSTSPSVTSGTLATPGEMAIAVISDGNAGGFPSWIGAWNVLSSIHSLSSGPFTSVAYLLQTGTGAVTASATVTSTKWTAQMVTLIPA